MEGQLMTWVINLVTGAVGGNVAGALLKSISLGTIGNTVAGLVGGGLGGQLLSGLLGGAGLGGTGGQIASAGIGSVVVMIVVGLIKKAMAKPA